MKTKKILFYMLAGILGGCVPVLSLHPLFSEKDIVFEGKLLGTWEDPNNKTMWQFSDANKPEKAYNLTFTDNEGKKGAFFVHLVNLKSRLFLDVYPAYPPYDLFPSEQEDPNKIKWPYNSFLMIPGHIFIKMNSIEPQLKLQFTDDDELKKLLQEDSNAIEHTSIENKPVLTASTEKLQAFVLKYADDKRVFGDEGVLNRKKTAEPNAPASSKPGKGAK